MHPPHVLTELARQDARLYSLRQQLSNLPKRIQELGAERGRLELQQKEAEGRWQQAEAGRRKIENEITEIRQRRTKSEGRLATLTSTEQYQALVKEIASHIERIEQLESQLLEAMERSEEAERTLAAERARVQQGVDALDAQRRSLEADLETAKTDFPSASAERTALLADVEPRLRATYERILKAKGDAGLALVSGSSCGICKAVQPPQVLQTLRQGVGLQACQMCGRILVWDGTSV